MKSMTARQHKVANEVHHLVALALVQGRIPSTLPLARVTVVDCWISADLRLARIYLQLPAGSNQNEFIHEANQQLPKALRKYLSDSLATKYIPQITFWPAEDEKSYPAPQPKQ